MCSGNTFILTSSWSEWAFSYTFPGIRYAYTYMLCFSGLCWMSLASTASTRNVKELDVWHRTNIVKKCIVKPQTSVSTSHLHLRLPLRTVLTRKSSTWRRCGYFLVSTFCRPWRDTSSTFDPANRLEANRLSLSRISTTKLKELKDGCPPGVTPPHEAEMLIAASKSGNVNKLIILNLFREYIVPELRAAEVSREEIISLPWDFHASHTSEELLKFFEAENIRPYYYPGHATDREFGVVNIVVPYTNADNIIKIRVLWIRSLIVIYFFI